MVSEPANANAGVAVNACPAPTARQSNGASTSAAVNQRGQLPRWCSPLRAGHFQAIHMLLISSPPILAAGHTLRRWQAIYTQISNLSLKRIEIHLYNGRSISYG